MCMLEFGAWSTDEIARFGELKPSFGAPRNAFESYTMGCELIDIQPFCGMRCQLARCHH